MSIRLFACVLLYGASLVFAAPPETRQDQDPQEIDVDAMARAKDAGATPAPADASAEATSEDASATTPPPEEAPPEPSPTDTPPTEAAAAEAQPPASDAGSSDTGKAPTENAPPAGSPSAGETPTEAPPSMTAPDAGELSIAASCRARAASLLDDAEKADYAGATRDFDAKMRAELPVPKFKQQWESLSQFGKLVARGQSHLGSGQGYTIVMIPLIFEKTNLVAQIACGSDGRIAGFHVTQAPKPQF
jgi:hypothetical protein